MHPHPYLQREIYEIMRRNPLISDAILIYPDSMRITKDDRITVQWKFCVTAREAVKYLFEKYGFLPNTFKDYRGKKIYDIILQYEKHGLTSEIRRQVEELHENKKREFEKWINMHKDEYFYKLKRAKRG